MLKYVISALLALISVACGPRYVDYFPYHDDGTAKPKVALMPIIDSSQSQLPWDFSEEISEGIYYELMSSGELFAVSPREMGAGWMKKDSIDFFACEDYSYAADFNNTDFIVSMEIIGRSLMPSPGCTQTMCVRIRIKILDIRYCEPKVVLYEVFQTTYTGIEKDCGVEGGICWNTESYPRSFCGLGHQRVIRCLAQRLEEVIWSIK
ncbi:MAG TPA: hypothetical protein VGP47_09700 [Parachlamydiaceae bacterium]|nr:hypothetical protein [Parachlamydiaceae bacterium]